MNVGLIEESKSYHEDVRKPEWQEAMKLELQALEHNSTWSLQPLPSGKHIIGCKWVFKVKYKLDRTLKRYKARLVAKGFT